MSEKTAEEKSESESNALREMFKNSLDVDEDVAGVLVQEGFSTIEEIAYVPTGELLGIAEFDEDIVKELRNRARDVLLTQAIASEEQADDDQNLLAVEGMTSELAQVLAGRGVHTRDDLADLAVDDLDGVPGIDPEKAGALIMAARAHLFQNDEQAQA